MPSEQMQNELLTNEADAPARPDVTLALTRGVARMLTHTGCSALAEFRLPNGRRVDVAGLDRKGALYFVEIKSCREDFAVDRKWQDYLGYCDYFYFATDHHFPQDLLPTEHGLILADSFGAEIIRPSTCQAIAPARRKAMLINYARQSALRLSASQERPLP